MNMTTIMPLPWFAPHVKM